MTEDDLKISLSEDIKAWTKSMLVDAKIADKELYLMSFQDRITLYAKRNQITEKIFTWRRDGKRPHRAVRTNKPLAIEEAMALIDDNWERRTFTRPR
jgi:hypothetical protein